MQKRRKEGVHSKWYWPLYPIYLRNATVFDIINHQTKRNVPVRSAQPNRRPATQWWPPQPVSLLLACLNRDMSKRTISAPVMPKMAQNRSVPQDILAQGASNRNITVVVHSFSRPNDEGDSVTVKLQT